ncbi:uncharacterized protein si:ch211-79k12.1 isoform X2 [Thalassophryne amazonica]|uniref:uncharacterized protein si:ch211-79k12.1 isoform X2 n=1 Tax=Thalassophryne amazonica TaxID=390379 RepID=UPI001470F5A0|nr:uncharacterized protein si:ch211-79k12.1 isoform X2 [Thalassophryne amazonica]
MKVLLAVLVVLVHGSYATLLIKGPEHPVVEGQQVTLECQYVDSELNISNVHFEYFSKRRQQWFKLEERWWCFSSFSIKQQANSLVLTMPHALSFWTTRFRCVSYAENVTAPDNSSDPLQFKVHYMAEPTLTMKGYSRYLGVPEDLKVRQGNDVVLQCSSSSSEEPNYFWQRKGDDWILPSSKLLLQKVTALDGGVYTCVAKHPSVDSLYKTRSISITVVPEDAPWYETINGHLILITSAVLVVIMVFIVSVTIFLCRRAKQTKTTKGPIDDRSQQKPIYRSSAESIPSACGDKQPLV